MTHEQNPANSNLEPGNIAPDFSLKEADGKRTLSDYEGQPVVVRISGEIDITKIESDWLGYGYWYSVGFLPKLFFAEIDHPESSIDDAITYLLVGPDGKILTSFSKGDEISIEKLCTEIESLRNARSIEYYYTQYWEMVVEKEKEYLDKRRNRSLQEMVERQIETVLEEIKSLMDASNYTLKLTPKSRPRTLKFKKKLVNIKQGIGSKVNVRWGPIIQALMRTFEIVKSKVTLQASQQIRHGGIIP